jgi:Protein of unknown function (DUF3460)
MSNAANRDSSLSNKEAEMNKTYVSEFTRFIDQFLKEHPDVVEEQVRNWREFWEPEIDPATAHARKEDVVPDDQYGFRQHTEETHH